MSKKTIDELLDEFRGMGGSYVVDPATGKRVLVARTAEAGEAVPDEGSDNLKEQENGTTEA